MPERLAASRYLDLLHRDGERLLAMADGSLDRQVPTCPGWRVWDVVDHLGTVYAHKIVALESGRRPEPGEWTGSPDGEDPVDWCHALLHRLAADLGRLEADSPAWTWWEADQTAGFWQRRMALETVIHRVDVESAVGEVTDIPEDLAVDGIDEVLRIMLADAQEFDVAGPAIDGPVVSADIGPVRVSGAAKSVLLWLWGRDAADDGSVALTGSPSQIDEVRRHLREATQ
jgi:uncharacterized protein (TIGR03083 family)